MSDSNESQFFFTVLSLLFFLFLAAFLQLASKRVRIPFTLLLVLAGMLIAFCATFFLGAFPGHVGNHDYFSFTLLQHLGNFSLSPGVVFYVFLPILVFESAFNLRFSQLRQSLAAITGLAVISLLVSFFFIGGALHYLLGLSWATSLLFGAIISATDPVAVLGTFKEVGAPRRLRTIVEGESLFNDGTSLVVFKIVLGIVLTQGVGAEVIGQNNVSMFIFSGIGGFMFNVFGGILFGVLMGFFFSKCIEMVRENQNVEMTLAMILAHATFLFAEHLGVSGIISTVVAGVILGNFGRNKISPSILEVMEQFWDHMAFIVNSLVFILIGIAVANSSSFDYWAYSLAAIGVVIVARFVSVVPVLSGLNFFSQNENDRMPFSWQVITAHGGLRGALAVVMLLLIPEYYPDLQILQAMTVAVVMFLFLVNATTIKWLLEKFGLMNFTPVDILEIEESHVLVAHSMREHLKKIYKKRYISEDVFHQVSNSYRKSEVKANEKIQRLFREKQIFSANELLLILKKHCLGVERKLYHQLFAAEEISEHVLAELVSSTERQRERLLLDRKQEKRKSPVPFAKRIKRDEKKAKDLVGPLIRYSFAKRWVTQWKKRQIVEKHERYRARRISAWNVLKHIDELEKNGLFLEGKALDSVRQQYQKWHNNAQEKQLELEKCFPGFLRNHKFYLTKRNCLTMERELIHYFFERDIVTQRVFMALQKSLQKRIKKIRKDALSDEEF